MYKNKDLANEYLFKGIKNEYPVGQVSESNQDNEGEKFVPSSEPGNVLQKMPTKDFTSIMASSESRNMQSGSNENAAGGGIMTKI